VGPTGLSRFPSVSDLNRRSVHVADPKKSPSIFSRPLKSRLLRCPHQVVKQIGCGATQEADESSSASFALNRFSLRPA
jgi:hypothetical protein